MKNKEAACIISLLDQVLTLIHLAKAELIQQYFPNWFFQEWKSEMGHEAIRDNLLILWFLFTKHFSKWFIVYQFLIIIFNGTNFSNLPPLLEIAFLSQIFSWFKLEITEATKQPSIFSVYFFHFLIDYEDIVFYLICSLAYPSTKK